MATSAATTSTMTGHLAIDHTVIASGPNPTTLPTALAIGPLMTDASTTAATAISMKIVTISRSGISLTGPRPSSISQIAFDTRKNAPMYPDADHSAPRRP